MKWLFHALGNVLYGRAGAWARVRREHLEREPECAACGGKEDLQVHHIVPYSVDARLELDPENLITLCAHPCHLVHGHFMSWQRFNPHVRQHCRSYRDGLERSKTRKG